MPRGGNHPKHPKCPHCGKALYKTMEKGKPSKKEQPFCYCRNEACEFYGTVQTEVESVVEKATEKQKPVVVESLECPEVSEELFLVSAEKSLLLCRDDDYWP